MFRATIAAGLFVAGLFSSVVVVADAAAEVTGPSFDCAKAAIPVEHAICADRALSALDAQLAAIYAEALAKAADGDKLRDAQRDWSTKRAPACGILPGADDDVPDFSATQLGCLADLYKLRLAELEALAGQSAAEKDKAHFLRGMWQLAEVIEAGDEALKGADQKGRIVRLDRHSLATLGGAGCARPTLLDLAEAAQRTLAADDAALLARAASLSPANAEGIAAFCLGRLFALYLPAGDGALLVAEPGALYRLLPLVAAGDGGVAKVSP
jgi:uncharacterized protein YecT (DUF1311 family)